MSKLRVEYLETPDGSHSVRVADLSAGGGGGGGSGPAGGVLSGSYPNPTFAQPMATAAQLNTALLSKQDKMSVATTAEMQAGVVTEPRAMSPRNISEAIQALAPGGGGGGGGTPSGPAGGVLGGSYPNPSFAEPMATQASLTSGLAGKANTAHTHPLSDLQNSGATTGQVITWNGTVWVPQTPASGGGSGAKPALGKLKNLVSAQTSVPGMQFSSVPFTSTGAIALNGALIDPGSPPWIRVPRAGYYRISFGVLCTSVGTGHNGYITRVFANAVPLFDGSSAFSTGGPGTALRSTGTDVVYLNKDAAVTLEVFPLNPINIADNNEKTSNWLTVEEVVNVL